MPKEYMDGMCWDTDKAEKVGEFYGQDHAHTETLYRTPNGRWFLVYNFHAPGFAMNPLDPEQVKGWMKDHQLMEKYSKFFKEGVSDA